MKMKLLCQDLMPTLVAAAGLPEIPRCINCNQTLCTDGTVVVGHGQGSSVALSQCPRPSLKPQVNSDQPKEADIRYMGYTCTTEKYKLAEWVAFENGVPKWNETVGLELYDRRLDPDENWNRSISKKYQHVVKTLRKIIRNRNQRTCELL